MDRWVEWSLENIKFDDEAIAIIEQYSGSAYTGDTSAVWAIPSSLIWHGQPDTWTGDGNHDNADLTCEIEGYGQEVGSTASWANGLIYYAAAKGVDTNTTKTADELIASDNTAEKALGYAKKMLDYQWETCRDDIGLTQVDTNSNLTRFFEESVYVPSSYHGTMPNGDAIESGATFFSLRTAYTNDPDYDRLKEAYDNGTVSDLTWTYHRFWHEGDALMANGVMASLFPDLSPETTDTEDSTGNIDNVGSDETAVKLDTTSVSLEVDESKEVSATNGTVTSWASADDSVATVDQNGKITGVSAGTTTVTATGSDGSTATVNVTVTEADTDKDTDKDTDDRLWGDVNVDKDVTAVDILYLKKYILTIYGDSDIPEGGLLNADVYYDGEITAVDLLQLKKYVLTMIDYSELGPQD
jgi:hypothetical protein